MLHAADSVRRGKLTGPVRHGKPGAFLSLSRPHQVVVSLICRPCSHRHHAGRSLSLGEKKDGDRVQPGEAPIACTDRNRRAVDREVGDARRTVRDGPDRTRSWHGHDRGRRHGYIARPIGSIKHVSISAKRRLTVHAWSRAVSCANLNHNILYIVDAVSYCRYIFYRKDLEDNA